MKPLERIFFKSCLMKGKRSVRDICEIYADMGFPVKILIGYVKKWWRMGFYDYGVTLDLGWFYIDELPVEYAKMREEVQGYVRDTKHKDG